jgi:membrane protease YdiL (CAAX protease family)
MALGVGITKAPNIQLSNYDYLIVNLFFLVGCILTIHNLNYSKEDIGLRMIAKNLKNHILFSLMIFSFYIFIIKISGLRPYTVRTIWSLITFAVVVLAEEIYFRGIIYKFIEKRYSDTIALIVSSIIFGLFHLSQGLGGAVSKIFSGWLWSSIRYSTGMIFLLIFPVHFTYNSIFTFRRKLDQPTQLGRIRFTRP